MKLVQKASYLSAKFISSQLGENHQKRSDYYFGFQAIYGAILKGTLIVLLSLVFNTVYPILVVALTFTSLRFFAGGVHMDTYLKCILITLTAFLPASIISKYVMVKPGVSLIIMGLVFLFSLFVLLKWAPKDSPMNQIVGKTRKVMKILSIGCLMFWCLIAILKGTWVLLAICLGIFIEVTTVFPVGADFYNKINKVIKIGG